MTELTEAFAEDCTPLSRLTLTTGWELNWISSIISSQLLTAPPLRPAQLSLRRLLGTLLCNQWENVNAAVLPVESRCSIIPFTLCNGANLLFDAIGNIINSPSNGLVCE